ncbi:MAG: outer membrane beta-barrel protein [Rhodobacteraceae bacterium]|nr:outer membrane beta-barrel protein [Paracoccaceae bacterium]
MTKQLIAGGLAALLATVALPAFAQSAGDWTVGVGVGYVQPKSDNGKLTANNLEVDVDSSTRPTVTAEYFVRDNLGIELLASWPFTHDVDLEGLGKVAETTQLPPTLSLQYHFNGMAGAGSISPFVGVGVNFTSFFDTDTKGALSGSKLELDNSWGFAAHAGVDYRITDNGSVRADVRYLDIDSEAKLDGAKIGTVEVDPWVFGLSYVHKF